VKGTQAKSLAAPTKRRTMSAASRKKIRGTTRSVGEGKGC
jgi:hypothetical protein